MTRIQCALAAILCFLPTLIGCGDNDNDSGKVSLSGEWQFSLDTEPQDTTFIGDVTMQGNIVTFSPRGDATPFTGVVSDGRITLSRSQGTLYDPETGEDAGPAPDEILEGTVSATRMNGTFEHGRASDISGIWGAYRRGAAPEDGAAPLLGAETSCDLSTLVLPIPPAQDEPGTTSQTPYGDTIICDVTTGVKTVIGSAAQRFLVLDDPKNVIYPGSVIDGQAFYSTGRFEGSGYETQGGSLSYFDATGLEGLTEALPAGLNQGGVQAQIHAAVGNDFEKPELNQIAKWHTSYSDNELAVGLSVKGTTGGSLATDFSGISGSTNFSYQSHTSYNTVVRTVLIPLYTVRFDATTAGGVFADEQDVCTKATAANNPPLVVSSVTYGSMVFYRASSTFDEDTIQAAIGAAVNGPDASINGEATLTVKDVLSDGQVEVFLRGKAALVGLDQIDGVQTLTLAELTTALTNFSLLGIPTADEATGAVPLWVDVSYAAPPKTANYELWHNVTPDVVYGYDSQNCYPAPEGSKGPYTFKATMHDLDKDGIICTSNDTDNNTYDKKTWEKGSYDIWTGKYTYGSGSYTTDSGDFDESNKLTLSFTAGNGDCGAASSKFRIYRRGSNETSWTKIWGPYGHSASSAGCGWQYQNTIVLHEDTGAHEGSSHRPSSSHRVIGGPCANWTD
ncbi:MAG: thiol-activated cytolysin family protein [Deferrisomatales bacterium]|nr:thiol-activated cytolysin family protein [Deferrisomatales bacterium]